MWIRGKVLGLDTKRCDRARAPDCLRDIELQGAGCRQSRTPGTHRAAAAVGTRTAGRAACLLQLQPQRRQLPPQRRHLAPQTAVLNRQAATPLLQLLHQLRRHGPAPANARATGPGGGIVAADVVEVIGAAS